MSSFSEEKIQRVSTLCDQNLSRFLLNEKCFKQQYNHMYVKRTSLARQELRKAAIEKWNAESSILNKIIDSESQNGGFCILIGTIYKEMKLHPSVLDEFKDQYGISGAVQTIDNFTSETDTVYLEDESGRVLCCGGVVDGLCGFLVTGVPMSVKGCINEEGLFEVVDVLTLGERICWSPCSEAAVPQAGGGIPMVPTRAAPASGGNIPTTGTYLALVSGLEIGRNSWSANDQLACDMFVDFVTGKLGGDQDIKLASRITRVIVAGNSVVMPATVSRDKPLSSSQHNDLTSPLSQLDMLLAELSASVPVDLLPGATDPANVQLPQQPLHRCLFPLSSRFSTFSMVTNPYDMSISSTNNSVCRVLGHAGQPLHDLQRHMAVTNSHDEVEGKAASGASGRLQGLEHTLQWGHLCPTSPDTLPCYPYVDHDPFFISTTHNDRPHIYFAGNQSTYESCVHQSTDIDHSTRLICIPAFSKTREVVLVDIHTLESFVMKFQSVIA